MRIGFHASHEQLAPSTLLETVQGAQRAGFDAAMCSDHFAPWGLAQGESGHAWSWLGAALATTSLRFGVVTAPGQRYHPAIIAQAAATLAEMFPGRFWAALGSGEAINEHITGTGWPEKARREQRLRESADIMRRLIDGETVDHDGAVVVDAARVWSRPAAPPPLLGAAVSADTARWVAEWADGLITVGTDPDRVAEVVDAYRDGGGTGVVALQVHLCLADSHAEGLAVAADQWRHATAPAQRVWDITQPEEFDRLADVGDTDTLESAVVIESDAERMATRLAELASAGFDELYLHEVGKDQQTFLRRAESELLPALRGKL
ncbi:MAG TPA: TIGR03885 family FMN-dependent LLM class oxidoreductase [Microbacterium sp.]|nr:TIGR03885 family FMN-dependent LLM class oxidoreductase [Microbacterium sp.]